MIFVILGCLTAVYFLNAQHRSSNEGKKCLVCDHYGASHDSSMMSLHECKECYMAANTKCFHRFVAKP